MDSSQRLVQLGMHGIEAHGLPGYFYNALTRFTGTTDFSGKRVLEIGGSCLPRSILFDTLGVSLWTSIDIINHMSGSYQQKDFPSHYTDVGVRSLSAMTSDRKTRYEIWDGAAEDINPDLRKQSYDIVISVNAFEHILSLERVLDVAYQVTTSGGLFLAHFGPIWSSIKGSHFWISQDLNFMAPGPVPPFAHLLMSPEELTYYLNRYGIGEDVTKRIVDQHFDSDFINRMFYEDYREVCDKSRWQIRHMEGLWDWSYPEYIHRALTNKYGTRNFSSVGIFLHMQKEFE